MASRRQAMFQIRDEKKFQRLLKCLEPLRENKVQVDNFTESQLLYVSPCLLLVRLFQVLTTIPSKEVRDSILAKANSLGICPPSYEMNLRHIYEVCLWMRTEAGIEAVDEVQRSEKLKRQKKERKVAESAIIKAFKAQFSEYRTEIKKVNVVLEEESGTVLRLQSKYWPVSAFDVDTNVLHREVVLDFCRKEGVKCGLYKYVEGLIERYKMESFALCAADNLRTILKEIECFEVPVSSKDENCRAGEKRKGIELVLGHEGETSCKRKTQSHS